MSDAPVELEVAEWPIIDDELQVGGLPLTLLADRVGRTPFYVYDRAAIAARVRMLRRQLPRECVLHYAIKANPMPALIGFMVQQVDGLDVASGGELRVALDAGMDPAKISFAGPGKTERELEQAVASGTLVNVESFREIKLLEGVSQRLGRPARVAVRVNPDFELKASGMKMGGGPKQFGIDSELVPQALAEIGKRGLAFEGFISIPARRTCALMRSAMRKTRRWRWPSVLPRRRRVRLKCSTLAAASAFRTSKGNDRWIWRRSAKTCMRWLSAPRCRSHRRNW